MNWLRINIGLVLLLLSWAWGARGQSYLCKTEKLSVEDGLSNRFVRSMVQDFEGFMWLATKNGLNRYDGYQFKVFSEVNHGLQSNFIDKIYMDADSNLWLGYAVNNREREQFKGIDIFNTQSFKPTSLEQKMDLPFAINEVYKIYPNETNHWLYILTTTGKIYVYKGKGKFELCYQHDETKIVFSFLEGQVYNWIWCGDDLIAVDKKFNLVARETIQEKLYHKHQFIGELNPSAVVLFSQRKKEGSKIWKWGLHRSLEKVDSLDFFQQNPKVFMDANFRKVERWDGYLYQTRDVITFYDANKRPFYTHRPKDGTFFRDYFVDNQGNIWLAITSEGIFKISCQKNKFTHYFKNIATRRITQLDSPNVLLVNAYGGRCVYDFDNHTAVQTKLVGLDLCKSQDGTCFWASTEDMEIKRIRLSDLSQEEHFYYKEGDVKQQQKNRGSEFMNMTWAVYEDKKERLWLGTANGIAYKDKEMDSIRIYQQYNAYTSLSASIVNFFYENEQGMWIASSSGLYLLDTQKGIVAHYGKDEKADFPLLYNDLLHIHEDKDGIFWLSTRGGGILRLDLKTKDCQQLTTEQGLSHNVVYSILEDERGDFWMGSDYGLMRFNPRSSVINTYLVRDGIIHEEFNHKSYYQAKDGRLYFGGIKGVIGFHPDDFLEKRQQRLPLKIIRYQYFDGQESALLDKTDDLLKQQEIVLNYTDRFFTLDYALLDYNADKTNLYAYKIKGLDEEWRYEKDNSIRINGLDAGIYTLLVKGQGSNGLWSTNQLEIPIVVKQPFYLTWQFLLAVVVALIMGIYGYFRWRVIRLRRQQQHLEEEVRKRTQKIKQQAEALKELDHVKSRFFANISHELRTPLTLMLGPISAIIDEHYGKDWKKVINILEIAKRNGGKLQNLIEEILVLSKLEAKNVAIELQEVNFLTFVRRLFLAFEAQAHLQEIHLELKSSVKEEIWVLLDDNKFEKILNNLLSNALKYTPRGGTIQLLIEPKKAEGNLLAVQLQVVDSGKGIHPQDLPYIFDRFYQSKHKEAIVQGGAGIGLALAYEFAQLLGGDLTVKSTLGEGSTFVLDLPMQTIAAPLEIQETLEPEASILPVVDGSKKEKATLLVVEDNDDMRTFVADLLGVSYTIITAENGRIALDILKEKAAEIDLIVSDVMMPEMDGFQLLEQVKRHETWSQLPVVMLTARAAEQDKLYALRIGVDDYLQKPFSRQELLVRIQNLLQNYRQRQVWQAELVAEELPQVDTDTTNVVEVPAAVRIEDDVWVKKLETITRREVGNTQFGVLNLAYDLNLSERQLRRKIKLKTGLTPNQYFRLIKLETAREYLEKRQYETVAEVAYKVGFNNVHYFTKIYRAQYGKKPIEYLRN